MAKVSIGAKYAGPNLFLDTLNKAFWCVSQKLTHNETKLQGLLLDKNPKLKPLWVDPRMVLPKKPATFEQMALRFGVYDVKNCTEPAEGFA